MVAEALPTTITNVPCVTAPLVEAKPSETNFDSWARLLTVKEKVPEVARLSVLKLTTEFVSVPLLLKKLPLVDKNSASVLKVVTMLLKVWSRSFRSWKLRSFASSKARLASIRSIGIRLRATRLSMMPPVSRLELIPKIEVGIWEPFFRILNTGLRTNPVMTCDLIGDFLRLNLGYPLSPII